MQQQADEEELGLSDAALAALREFALENNLGELVMMFYVVGSSCLFRLSFADEG